MLIEHRLYGGAGLLPPLLGIGADDNAHFQSGIVTVILGQTGPRWVIRATDTRVAVTPGSSNHPLLHPPATNYYLNDIDKDLSGFQKLHPADGTCEQGRTVLHAAPGRMRRLEARLKCCRRYSPVPFADLLRWLVPGAPLMMLDASVGWSIRVVGMINLRPTRSGADWPCGVHLVPGNPGPRRSPAHCWRASAGRGRELRDPLAGVRRPVLVDPHARSPSVDGRRSAASLSADQSSRTAGLGFCPSDRRRRPA
jgi:hypothetical protein